ncbi:unnamed protein product [Sphagnum compactum]
MAEIFSIGEKWLKSVTSARTLTWSSSSGRAEVPARAMAAAVIARRIAALPPHERGNLTERSGSFYTSKPHEEQQAEELEKEFYEEEFDPVRYMLQDIPEHEVKQSFFDHKVGQRLLQLEEITEKLSKQVMEHHEEMVKGMQLVTELERDLQVSSIIVKNGRRHLSRATFEVSQDLVVAANVRKKQVSLDMIPVLERIQQALDIKSQLDGAVDKGNYSTALEMCSQCLLLLEECSELSAVQEMNQSIEDWLQKTIGRVDALLMEVCRKFEAEKYATVINAYTLLDDVTSLAEKVQSFYAQLVFSETHDVIKNLLFQIHQSNICVTNAHVLQCRLPYRDLCLQLPEAKFRQFLSKTLEVLFDLMGSYHTLMTWQKHSEHRRSGSHDNLSQIVRGSRHVRTSSLSSDSSVVRQSSSGSPSASRLQAQGGIRNKLFGDVSDAYENGTSTSSGEFDLEGFEDDTQFSFSLSKREEKVQKTVARALERGRKTVWELAARRVAALLSNDAISTTSSHQFLQSLDSVNKFILIGEAFCGAEAVSLRTKLAKQSELYFGTLHRQNLEVLRMIVEKETWQQLSSVALNSVNLAGLTGHGASLLQTPATKNDSDTNSNGRGEKTISGISRAGFADWVKKGNPFTEKGQSHGALKPVKGDGDDANGMSKAGGTAVENNGARSPTWLCKFENEDLLADFIDEDSQLPGRLYHNYQKDSSTRDKRDQSQAAGGDKGVMLTNSSVSVLRYIDKYARLMQVMQPVASEVFKGLCQLFELYFFSIFKTFGQREAFSGTRSSSDSYLLTPRLRAILLRISQGLEEQRLKYFIAQTPTSPATAANASSVSSMPSEMQSGSVSRECFVQERKVATQSLSCLADMLKRSRPWLQAMLPQNCLASVEYFYARMVDIVPNLIEHLYKAAARMLLNIGGYIERIANVRWELKDLGMEHNGYIDVLLGEYKQFSTKLAHGSLDKEMLELLLEYGVDTLAETLVEGLSRVRRCNNEGRALMSLDLQVLINGLQHLAPPRLRSNLQIVETYIKAFYLPETESLHWVRTHPEYTKSQVIGLINLVATANNWKRKSRVDMVERIEAGDL